MSSEYPNADSPQNSQDELGSIADVEMVPTEAPTDSDASEEIDSEAKWLHPSSLLFGVLSHARQLVIPLILALFSAAKGSVFGLWVAGGFFLVALVATTLRYLTLRYQVKGGDLIVMEGIIFRRVRTVPIRRIQNMDLVQNIVHRIFQVAEVKVETASGTEPEATLRVLTMSQIQELREQVFDAEPKKVAVDANWDSEVGLSETAPIESPEQGTTVLKVPTSWLIKAGLASNRGGIIFGVMVGFLFQFDLEDFINWDDIRSYVPDLDGSVQSILLFTAGISAVLILLRIFGIIWYVLRFYDYELVRVGEDLRIRCGLFTKVSATVPRKRIQFISVHRPLLLRWMKMAVIRIETAGGSGAGNEDAATTVSRRWFVPVVDETLVDSILLELRPGLKWDAGQADWVGLSKRAPARMMRISIVFSLLVGVGGFFALRPWGALIGVGLMPLFVLFAYRKSQSMKYARTPFGVVYRSGILTKKLSMTFFERIQTLRVNQSPFDRRWNMAKLVVDTAAAGPAEHRIDVGYLDEKFAAEEFDTLTRTSAEHRPNWNA